MLLEGGQLAPVQRDLRLEVRARCRARSRAPARGPAAESVTRPSILLIGEQVAEDPQRELGLLVQHRGGLDLLGLLLDVVPERDQARHVVHERLFGGALGGGAHDHAVSGGLHLLQDRLQALALVVGEPAADAGQVLVGREHEVASGQRDLGREPRALAAHRVLGDLDHDGLAGLQHVLDAGSRCLRGLPAE